MACRTNGVAHRQASGPAPAPDGRPVLGAPHIRHRVATPMRIASDSQAPETPSGVVHEVAQPAPKTRTTHSRMRQEPCLECPRPAQRRAAQRRAANSIMNRDGHRRTCSTTEYLVSQPSRPPAPARPSARPRGSLGTRRASCSRTATRSLSSIEGSARRGYSTSTPAWTFGWHRCSSGSGSGR